MSDDDQPEQGPFEDEPWDRYETELEDPSVLVGLDQMLREEYGSDLSGEPLDGSHPWRERSEEGEYIVDVTYLVGDGAEIEVEEDDGDYELAIRTAPDADDVEERVRSYIEDDTGPVEIDGITYTAEPEEEPLFDVVQDRKRLVGLESALDETYDTAEIDARDGEERPRHGNVGDDRVLEDARIRVQSGDEVIDVDIETKHRLMSYSKIQVDGEDRDLKEEVMEEVRDYVEEHEDPGAHEYRRDLDYDLAWDDVGGLEEQKQVLRENVLWPMTRPELFDDEQRSNGLLLHGPPGTGKTMLVRTLVSEMDDAFDDEVGLYVGDPNNLGSKYVSENAENVYDLFDEAKAGSPSVVFLDELDSIASQRTDGDSGAEQERNDQVNAVLQNMDGVEDLDDVVVIGTTNLLDNVDDAALRGGRFDEQHEVPLPGEDARERIWEIHTEDLSADVDYDALVEQSAGLPGSDIEAASQKAYRVALRDAVDAAGGIEEVDEDDIIIEQDHLEDALADITGEEVEDDGDYKTFQ